MTDADLHSIALTALHKIGESEVAAALSIYWNARMRSAAGRAKLTEWTVEMNPRLLDFGQSEVRTTLLHELAHLVAWRRSRHRGHGAAWRAACADLGIPGERVTHTLPLPRRSQRKKYRYECGSCGVSFQRVRRVTRPSACLHCCRKYNGGKFSEDYLLREFRLEEKK